MKYLNKTGFNKFVQSIKDYVNKKSKRIFSGTLAEWNALTEAEQAKYDFVASPED